jgi:hypothetical protein
MSVFQGTSHALALTAVLFVGAGACARHAETPPGIDAAPARPVVAAPPVVDAAVDRVAAQVDARVDAQPDLGRPPHGHAHRAAPAPRAAAAGGFKVSGSITKAEAESVLRGARGKLDVCYDREHAKNPALGGRVTFRLSIDNGGRVPLAEVVSSTLGSGDPELCMVEALRDLKFPPSATGGESTLSFPMTFGR